MIVKFYKGPWHNKKREFPDTFRDDYIRVAKNIGRPLVVASDIDPREAYFDYGHYERTRHTHPDGSVFFVWKP